MKGAVPGLCVALLLATPAAAGVSITVDTSLAERTLGLVCSNQSVDEAAVRASPLVQAQVRHNRGIVPSATMDTYVAALRGAAGCHPPDPDTFRIGDVIAHRDAYRHKVDTIRARRQELAREVSRRLTPYMPAGADFSGSVVLAVPYFSCGGFSTGGSFFIDVRCLDENLDSDFTALTLLVAHETYHAIQSRYFHQGVDDPDTVRSPNDAVELLLEALLLEGSASHVAPYSDLPEAGGPLTQLDRSFARANAARLAQNFALMSILLNEAARSRTPRQTALDAYRIGFSGGSFQEMGYFVGARMAGDIERAWGRAALVCVMQMPPEQFVLAHDAATSGVADALRLSTDAVDAARALARQRHGRDFATCRAERP